MKSTLLSNLLVIFALLLGSAPFDHTAKSQQTLDDMTVLGADSESTSGNPSHLMIEDDSAKETPLDILKGVPLIFIENKGQFGEGARFQVYGGDHTIWLTKNALWITLIEPIIEEEKVDVFSPSIYKPEPQVQNRLGANVRLSFPGVNPHLHLEPFNRLDTNISYFVGSDPNSWYTDVPVWGGVRYVNLYPDIDLEIVSENGHLVQRLVARPGADLHAMRLQVNGADQVTLHNGGLRMMTPIGEFTMPLFQVVSTETISFPLIDEKPGLVQSEADVARVVEVTHPFSFTSPSSTSFSSPQDNPSDLLYATFLGEGSSDAAGGITVDAGGATYVTGWTNSSDFPTTPGAFDLSQNGDRDISVVKFDASGSELAYATFIGGSDSDYSLDIEVDADGAAYVVGNTFSSDFPTTLDAFDTTYNGDQDVVAVKLNADGSGLIYATFLGGVNYDYSVTIDIDGYGAAYVAGDTESSDFPTTSGAFDTTFNDGTRDVFVVKLNASGSDLTYGTFLGGSHYEGGFGLSVDSSGAAYTTGWTYSTDFPVTPGAFDTTHNGYHDAFVAKLNAGGNALVYATFLGHTGADIGVSIVTDSLGQAYVAGATNSSGFPTTPEAFDITYNGDWDLFIVKLGNLGSDLQYSTFLGGSQDDGAWDSGPYVSLNLTIDEYGAAYVTGATTSSNFPTTLEAFDTTFNGEFDVFVAKLDITGSDLSYSSFLGGSEGDFGSFGIAIDSNGVVYITGITYSSDFPITSTAFDTTYNGSSDIFMAKLATGMTTFSISGRVTDDSGNPISDVTVSTGAGIPIATDASGYYTISRLVPGTYTIMPYKTNYGFTPPSHKVNVPPSATDQDFIGALCSPDQWYGEYYSNRDLSGSPTLTRCDQQLDFYWGTSSPAISIPADNFSARWERTIDFSKAGSYRFRTLTDDGSRLFVDDQRVIDDWSIHTFEERSAVVYIDQGFHKITMEYFEWTADALIYLNWYLCPNGQEDCSLGITPLYQTQYLTNPMPSDCKTESNQTIARWGCTITSVAMALQHYGVNTTPAELNQWLTENDGYRGGECVANLKWPKVLEFAAKPEHGGVNLRWRPTNDAASKIRAGYPVIMNVDEGGHYILAVDVIEVEGAETLGINDPHHAFACKAVQVSPPPPPASTLDCRIGLLRHATTIPEESVYRGRSVALKYLEETEDARTASMQLWIQEVEAQLIDFQGRRVGYDQVLGQVVIEIPDAFYYDAEIVPAGELPTSTLARTMYLPQDAGGFYTLRIIGPMGLRDNGQADFIVQLFGFDAEFNPSEAEITGSISAGEVMDYLVWFEPGQMLTVGPISRIYLPIILNKATLIK